ncbi:Na+/H+ antiporter subunit E [Cellulomonas marina]|uniref:Multicomponent Na+:H+ antiporter subunit E n=1 Tax=Cellulomonas marina TaxID=988821 RepID=A0A1I0YBN5_9CELL|nr:Na+/H+ antiporter subunit E [Cellulomonas marina]GIG29636.1 sodium:proton antiporter [Cellulomonas marina]SFB10592.1 multicomponent Na+:H+ antiporter subunit E [Cellulomonas marina]
MSLHPRRRWRPQWLTVVWLTVVWVLLWGDLSVANVLVGALLGLLVTGGLRMAPVVFHGRVRPLALVRLVAVFVVDLVRASAEVSWVALRPGRRPRSAVVRVELRSHSDLYMTVTAELLSLVPGSVVVEAHRLTGRLYIHVLDVGLTGGVEGARQQALDQEERVLRAFASDEELRAAGLLPGRAEVRA